MPEINREEYEILKELDDKWKWIARDLVGELYIFVKEPYKDVEFKHWSNDTCDWSNYTCDWIMFENNLFHFIQWEDEEPYNIAELIREYESEEAEVKRDSEWMKEEFRKLERTGVIDSWVYRDLWMMANQLDEPEVLSQGLPVIPKFVADWYEIEGKRSSWWNWFYKWGRDESRTELESKTIRWMQDYNEEKFVDIFRYGYEVEEEQLFYVVDKYNTAILSKGIDGNPYPREGVFSDYFVGHEDYMFTEKEIKDYDERYIPFMVPVDEVNNE